MVMFFIEVVCVIDHSRGNHWVVSFYQLGKLAAREKQVHWSDDKRGDKSDRRSLVGAAFDGEGGDWRAEDTVGVEDGADPLTEITFVFLFVIDIANFH